MNIGSYHSPQTGINGLNNAFIIAQRTYRETQRENSQRELTVRTHNENLLDIVSIPANEFIVGY